MKIFNIPNTLTFTRLGLVPVFSYFFLKGQYGPALAFFLVAGVTDFLDGVFARRLHARTPLGAVLDPAADKILMATTFVILAVAGALPVWVAALILAKDVYVVLGVSYLKARGRFPKVKPSALSKFNTGCQLFLITLCFFYSYYFGAGPWIWPPESPLKTLLSVAIYFTVAMTTLTAIQYTLKGWRFLKGAPEDGIISHPKNQAGRQ